MVDRKSEKYMRSLLQISPISSRMLLHAKQDVEHRQSISYCQLFDLQLNIPSF